jgi:hypothetical protein
MSRDEAFEMLAQLLRVPPEALADSIGDNWTSTYGSPNLLIRGSDVEYRFEADDDDHDDHDDHEGHEDDEEASAASYPDVGILFDLRELIHIGTLEGIYTPAPSGYGLKNLITLSCDDPQVLEKLVSAIEHLAQVAIAELQVCMYCKEKLPPYLMSEDGYCYSCGEEELGLVH